MQIFGMVVHLDHIWVKFVGQGHRSVFKVTGGNNTSGWWMFTAGGLWRIRLNYDRMTLWPVLA